MHAYTFAGESDYMKPGMCWSGLKILGFRLDIRMVLPRCNVLLATNLWVRDTRVELLGVVLSCKVHSLV